MKKAVMLSVQPRWCELIAQGEKTVEIRKNRPKLEPPFTCYIYRTKGFVKHLVGGEWIDMPVDGTVIGEFTCDRLNQFKVFENATVQDWHFAELENSCLTYEQVAEYVGLNHYGYAWHISNLKLYNKSKLLGDFKVRKTNKTWSFTKKMNKPPQSWCYIEED